MSGLLSIAGSICGPSFDVLCDPPEVASLVKSLEYSSMILAVVIVAAIALYLLVKFDPFCLPRGVKDIFRQFAEARLHDLCICVCSGFQGVLFSLCWQGKRLDFFPLYFDLAVGTYSLLISLFRNVTNGRATMNFGMMILNIFQIGSTMDLTVFYDNQKSWWSLGFLGIVRLILLEREFRIRRNQRIGKLSDSLFLIFTETVGIYIMYLWAFACFFALGEVLVLNATSSIDEPFSLINSIYMVTMVFLLVGVGSEYRSISPPSQLLLMSGLGLSTLIVIRACFQLYDTVVNDSDKHNRVRIDRRKPLVVVTGSPTVHFLAEVILALFRKDKDFRILCLINNDTSEYEHNLHDILDQSGLLNRVLPNLSYLSGTLSSDLPAQITKGEIRPSLVLVLPNLQSPEDGKSIDTESCLKGVMMQSFCDHVIVVCLHDERLLKAAGLKEVISLSQLRLFLLAEGVSGGSCFMSNLLRVGCKTLIHQHQSDNTFSWSAEYERGLLADLTIQAIPDIYETQNFVKVALQYLEISKGQVILLGLINENIFMLNPIHFVFGSIQVKGVFLNSSGNPILHQSAGWPHVFSQETFVEEIKSAKIAPKQSSDWNKAVLEGKVSAAEKLAALGYSPSDIANAFKQSDRHPLQKHPHDAVTPFCLVCDVGTFPILKRDLISLAERLDCDVMLLSLTDATPDKNDVSKRKVLHHKGSPLRERDLEQVGILAAKAIFVINSSQDQVVLNDSAVVVFTRMIEERLWRLSKGQTKIPPVICELTHDRDSHLLVPIRPRNEGIGSTSYMELVTCPTDVPLNLNSRWASGQLICIRKALSSLLGIAYESVEKFHVIKSMMQSSLTRFPIGEKWAGLSVGRCMHWLMTEKGLLAVALARYTEYTIEPQPEDIDKVFIAPVEHHFIITNPSTDIALQPTDYFICYASLTDSH